MNKLGIQKPGIKSAIAKFLITLVIALVGYGILLLIDWRIAIGCFFIHWSINLEATIRNG